MAEALTARRERVERGLPMGYGKRAFGAGKGKLLRGCEVVAEELEMSLERLKEFTKLYLELMPPEGMDGGSRAQKSLSCSGRCEI